MSGRTTSTHASWVTCLQGTGAAQGKSLPPCGVPQAELGGLCGRGRVRPPAGSGPLGGTREKQPCPAPGLSAASHPGDAGSNGQQGAAWETSALLSGGEPRAGAADPLHEDSPAVMSFTFRSLMAGGCVDCEVVTLF